MLPSCRLPILNYGSHTLTSFEPGTKRSVSWKVFKLAFTLSCIVWCLITPGLCGIRITKLTSFSIELSINISLNWWLEPLKTCVCLILMKLNALSPTLRDDWSMALNRKSKFTLVASREQLLSESFTSMSLFGDSPLIALILASCVDLSNSKVVLGRMQEALGLVLPSWSLLPSVSSCLAIAALISAIKPCYSSCWTSESLGSDRTTSVSVWVAVALLIWFLYTIRLATIFA